MNDMPVFGPDQVSTKTALEDIAIETGTPVEVLFAAGEQAGAKTPDEFLNIARQRGQQLGPRFKAGEDPTAIVGEVFGPEAQRSFGDYATEIRAQLYGTPTVQQRNQAELENEGIGGTLKRRGQQFVRGLTEPFAAMPEAAAIAQAQTDNADTPAADMEGFARGQQMRDSVADTFGAPNPEDRSFWGMVAEGAGNLVGMGGASLAAGVAGTAVGGPVGGTVAGLTTGAGIGAAMNTSQLYREARDMGADEAVAEQAARWGALIGASEIVPIARAFKYLPQGVRQKVGNGVMKRFVDIAQSAGEEAAQEYLATVANNMVAQQLYDPDRGWTEGATESALVGAVLGAGAGTLGAGVDAYRNRQQPGPLPQPPANPNTGQGNPSAPPGGAPQPGMVPPVSGPGQEPEQGVPTPTADVLRPQPGNATVGGVMRQQGSNGDKTTVTLTDGAKLEMPFNATQAQVDEAVLQYNEAQRPAAPSPVSDVLAGAPQSALGGFQPDQPVQIQLVDPETGELSDPIDATFVGEDPAQGYASFRGPDGAPAEIDLADIASGNVIVSPAEQGAQVATQPQEQAIVPPAQGAGQQPAQPVAEAAPPIPAGVDPDAFMERVAIRQADGMSPDEAYALTLQDALDAMRQDVGAIAADVEDRQRQERENQSRIDEAVFTDDRGQPVVFPTEATALGRLGAGYTVEPFGEGFIGIRQQETTANEGNANDGVGGDGNPATGGGNIAAGSDADRETVAGGRDGAALGPVEQGAAQGVADAAGDADGQPALTPESVALEAARIRRRESDASQDSRVDPVAKQEQYLRNIARDNPEQAAAIAKQMRDAPQAAADAAGVSTDRVGAYASIIERQLKLISQNPVKKNAPENQDVAPVQPETAPADQETDPIRAAVRDAITAGPIQHTTIKGKVLDGYILKGMTPAQVKQAFDTGAFFKDGGTFIRKDRAEAFLGADAQGAGRSDINQKAVAKVNAALKPDNKDGLGYYVSGSDSFQIDALDDGDAEITITTSKSRYEGRAKVTSENSQRVKFSDVRDSLSPEARAAVEEFLAFDPDAEPAAAEAEPPVRKRPAIGSPEYTLIDARNDLIDMQTEEAAQGMIGDGRLLSRIERQKALIKQMEKDADDLAAKIEAAAAETDPNPTEAQKEAENYRTGKTTWNGLTLSIENAKGSERSKKTPDGKTQWSVTMPAHYGRILRTEGADGDHVDFYMGDVPDSDYVLIINQVDPETQQMDEHKVIVGTTARGAALGIYRDGFSDGSGNSRIGSFTETNVANLKAWLASGETKDPTQPIDMPFAKRKAETKTSTQGTSNLPGGVQDGETRAEDQGAAKIMLRRARERAGELNDTDAYKKFMVDGRKPVSEQLVQEAENYIRDNQSRRSGASNEETGPFGPIIKGFEGDWKGAALELERLKTGEAPGALSHPDVGDIALVWGQEGTSSSDGMGLAKLLAWHPEVLDDLQGRLSEAEVVSRTEGRIQLRSKRDNFGIRLQFDSNNKTWLLTAFERGRQRTERSSSRLSDIWDGSFSPAPLTQAENDTANLENQAAASGAMAANPAEMSADDILNAAFDDVFGAAPEAAPQPEPEQAPQPEAETAALPESVETALSGQIDKKKARLKRLRSGNKPGVTELEAEIRKMRQEVFNAEDAAAQAIAQGDPSLFAPYAEMFPDAAEAISDETPVAAPRAPRTAGEAAKSAASNAAEGIGNIVDGLNALFGGANRLSSGLTFDAETYAKAKPMFIAAVRAFGRAGQDIMDMARAMVRGLSANGLTQEAQENMRPYLTQFINDMRDGTVDPFAEDVQAPAEGGNVEADQPEAANEQYGNQEGDTGEPAPQEDGAGAGQSDGAPDSEPADDGSREGYEDGEGANAGDDAGGGLGDGPGSVSDRTGDARAGTPPPNYVIADDFPLGEGTEGQKLAANIEALRLVRTLEQENRYATQDEQAVLARWVGWGGLKTVFDAKHEGTTTQWGRAQAELKELLSTEEYIAAMRSTNDAHYTSRTVVKAMWRAMRNFGFEGGRALEPTIGSGNFLGLQPADLSAKTEWFAAELDPTTGKIAKHLYPQARVFDGMGFQDAPFKRAAFDVAIGNPPFGATQIGNKKLHPDLGKMKVHNFIIAKTGQLLREGGVMSMVVTHRFLDTPNPEARTALAPDFRFLGAIRLPNTAFEANANTQVTTDIVFFQKRREGETDNDTTWLETGVDGPNGTKLNGYFAANPDMILGRAAMDGTMYAGGRKEGGAGEFTVHADGRDLEASLDEAIDRIQATIPNREQALEAATTARENSSTLPYGAMTLTKDGRIFRGEEDEAGNRVVEEVTAQSFWKDNAEAQGRVVTAIRAALAAKGGKAPLAERLNIEQEAKNAAIDVGLVDLAGDPVTQKTKYETALAENLTNLLFSDKPRKAAIEALDAYSAQVERKRLGTDGFERLSAMLDMRQKTRELIALERADGDTKKIEASRRRLREAYRAFQKKYGYLNNSKNEAILRGDVGPEFALELGYRPANKEGRAETAKEAPILEKRVIYPHKRPDAVDSVADGLHISMQERGYIDPALIGQLTSKTTEEVVAEMTSGAEPLAFRNPKTGRYEIAEVYLSGNLAEKIADAERAGMYQNVPHLKNAMPPPKAQEQITPSIRSLWIPPEVFTDFLQALGYNRPKVELFENVGMASIDAGGTAGLTDFGKQFETERMDPARIFEHAIKGKIPVVYDTIRTPDGDKRVKNEEATREAVASYDRMTREFPEWAYANPERAGKIVDAFNEKMNVVTERKYQGVRYLRMVGNSPEIDLRNSQKNGAWRMIQDKVTLLHHVVGAGKTFTAIAGVMERKRMGLSRKAVVAVPNHLTGQWGREWLELYPAANILVPTEKDFEPANRAKLINRIATGDFDAVIVGHSQLTKINNDPEVTTRYISEQIEELNAAMQQAKASGESKRTVGQMGTRLSNLSQKLRELQGKLAEKADTKVLGWQDLGVDYMVVDEAHLFKNLEYTTTASQLVGMNAPGGSQRAFDMLMKVRSIQGMQGGGVSFLTGTPVSNSLVEIYSMMKYLIPDSLRSMGIQAFDGWKAAFIQDESRFEYTASMQLKERNIMSGMINLGPLAQLYRSFADIVMRPDVERMFTEQMEARNAAEPDPAKQVPTKFPTPKIKGGARRISLAPPTEKMKEFVRYLVMRMAGIKANKSNKDYLSVDNALWVLTDARKASVDIRTIDPTLGREEGSKVDRASAEVFRIWQENAERKGAQMVFSDMSAPTKSAEKSAKSILKAAYEKLGIKGAALKARMEAEEGQSYAERWGNVIDDIEQLISSPDTDDRKRDSLNEFIDSEAAQDASAAMFTADTGFSFYDDMRAALIEKGVPENEIAFIHDYDTTAKKAQLFDAVNEGNIRVLLGSTQKMGAGTNAQKRLVALHHIDAPWRPSDMEQREGRIIRQGNLFYQQDPEGFEVEIVAYSTEQTADVVQWQVLERKAASIETFLNAAADTVIEEGGDADQYAEFMAQSTGKEVFLQKMQAEKARDTARAEVASTLRNLSEADRFVRSFDESQKFYGDRAEAFAGFSLDMIGDGADSYLSDWEATAAAYRADKERIEAEREQVRLRNADRARKDWEKLPELPTAPARWETRPESGWERKVYNALDGLQGTGGQQSITVGPFTVQIVAKAAAGGITEYRAFLVPPGVRNAEITLLEGWSAEVKDFRRSDKLLNAFSPANIAMRAKEAADRYAKSKQRHAETLPQMQEIKERGVDMSKVERAQERLDRLTALVRIEEVKFASETSSAGPNYFAERDDKGRDLIADNTAQPLTGQFQFTNAGQNYASEWGAPDGSRRIEGTDRSGLVAYFEANNMDTGEPVVVEAIRTKEEKDGQPEEWEVLNVWGNDPLAGMTQEELERLDRALTSLGITSNKTDEEMRLDDDGGANFRASISKGAAKQGAPFTTAKQARQDLDRIADLIGQEIGRTTGRKVSFHLNETAYNFGKGYEALDGFFLDGVIGVSAASPDGPLGVARHEVIHALRSPDLFGGKYGAFTKEEWQTLVRAARKNKPLREQTDRLYAGKSETIKIEEIVAEMYREWSDGKDMGLTADEQKAFATLRRILDAIINVLRGNGLQTAADVFDRVRSGEVGNRGPDGPGRGARTDATSTPEIMASISKLWSPKPAGSATAMDKKEAGFVSNLLTNAMASNDQYNSLGLVPGEVLFRDLAKNLPSAGKWVKTMRQMTAERQEMHAEADVLAREWQGLYAKDKANGRALHDLMHETTIEQLDPSERFRAPRKPVDMTEARYMNFVEEKRAKHAELRDKFNALPENMRSIYRRARDAYKAFDAKLIDAMVDAVVKAMDLQAERLKARYEAELQKFQDDGLEGDDLKEAKRKARSRFNQDVKMLEFSRNARIRKMRLTYESNRIEGPYFPLMRFGQFFIAARNEKGKLMHFERASTAGAQRRIANEMRAQGFVVETGVMKPEDNISRFVDPNFVADITEAMGEAGADSQILDAIYQRYLETLPSFSIRKANIHRQGVPGFDKDAIRAFGSRMFHGAHQLTRLRHAMDLTKYIESARREAKRQSDPVRAGALVNEMQKRHDWSMNPQGAEWSAWATSAAFVWYLGLTPAAAITNISQTTVVGIPMLAAGIKGGSVAKAAKALSGALADFTAGLKKGDAEWSRGALTSGRLAEDERKALQAAYLSGALDKSQAHDIAAIGESGAEYSPIREKVMRPIAFLFHHAERLNREVTFLAAYRMAKEAGMDPDAATVKAGDLTWDIHFNYENWSRPRFMQGDVARVIFTFRQFQVNMLYRLFRDTHQALKGESPEVRKQARAQLIGITASMMAHAGITGTWGYALIMLLAGMFMEGGSDEAEEELKNAIVSTFGPGAGGLLLKGVPGHLTGTDMTARLGMPELWFRSPDRQLEGKEAYN